MKNIIRCYNCDSEYIIEYEQGLLADAPQFCIICKESIEPEDFEEEE